MKQMAGSAISERFGEGCPHCRSHSVKLQGNYCPKCGTVYACRDISFDVYDGEILGVVGESGSGKSTMMQCLYFDQEVTGGSCTIRTYKNGAANIFELTAQQQRYIRNHVLGMVYQNPYLGLKMNFSSMGNIAEKLIAAGKRNVKAMSERGEELLNAVKIPVHRMKEEPRKFSGGMQQRVQIAKALSNNPPILLLDEVTARCPAVTRWTQPGRAAAQGRFPPAAAQDCGGQRYRTGSISAGKCIRPD